MTQRSLALDTRLWVETRDGDPNVRVIFDRHYSRRHYLDGRDPALFVSGCVEPRTIWRTAEVVAAWPVSSRAQASCLIDAVFDAVADGLSSGAEVNLAGFGRFSVADRPARVGRNPSTGAPVDIAASRQVKFRPHKRLRDRVQ